jgi:hypothetical protein
MPWTVAVKGSYMTLQTHRHSGSHVQPPGCCGHNLGAHLALISDQAMAVDYQKRLSSWGPVKAI